MKTIDKTVSNLCSQIDELQEEVNYWQKKYEEEIKERQKEQEERFTQVKTDLANTVAFAMCMQEDKDGSLFISSEDRKDIINNWRK